MFLVCLAPLLLAALGCGIESKVAGKWQGRDEQMVLNIHFDPTGEMHATGTGYPDQHGTWRVVREDRTSAKLAVNDGKGVWEADATFHGDRTAVMRIGERTFTMTMVEGPPKSYASSYFLVALSLTLTLIVFFTARRRAEEPADMAEARRQAPKSLFHVETAVDRGA